MNTNKTVVVNLGVANYGSMMNMLNKVGADAILSDRADDILNASRIVLPGVGAFDAVMGALNKNPKIRRALEQRVLVDKIPFMGVCVGMQLLFSSSEEGSLPGLGWVSGSIKKFVAPQNERLPIPHMGWNLTHIEKESPLLDKSEKQKFYFVHSYRAIGVNKDEILASTQYGGTFVSAVNNNNIFGFQFHPEKSHRFGMNLFEKFIEL